jgi:Transposase domain (DUF772).
MYFMQHNSYKIMQETAIYRKPMGKKMFEKKLTIGAFHRMDNHIEKQASLVDFEMFRLELEDVLVNKDCKTSAERRQIDVERMFKVIFLQCYYGLGDHQIIDHISFRQFFGFQTVVEILGEKAVWTYKNKLASDGMFDHLFDEFRSFLNGKRLFFNKGKIVDAIIVETLKQMEVNQKIKNGNGIDLCNPDENGSDEEWAVKKCCKNVDMQRTKCFVGEYYGCMNHVEANKKLELIENCYTSGTSVHGSNVISPFIGDVDRGQDLYLDGDYESKEDVAITCVMNPIISESGHRERPLTDEQKHNNYYTKSKTRSRVEHIFSFLEGPMNGSLARGIGMMHAKAANALTDLDYNIFRHVLIKIYQPQLITNKAKPCSILSNRQKQIIYERINELYR